MAREIKKRFIDPGPSLNQLLCIKLNPAFDKDSVLSSAQVALNEHELRDRHEGDV